MLGHHLFGIHTLWKVDNMSMLRDSRAETLPNGLPDVDKHSCQLLGPTALIIQGLMGVLVVLSLVYKRHRERPKRPWGIWLFDVSKQVVGQLFVHILNLLVSHFTSGHTSGNPCVSYFLNILIDTTFGVALIYVGLHAFTRLFTEKLQLKGFESGVYGNPPSFKFWIRQAALYILSLTTMKVVVVTFMALFPGIYSFGKWLLKWTWLGEQDDFQVVFVMGIFPILMNIIQFWLIDSIVKASSMAAVALDIEHGTQHDTEPLFQGGSDDEDSYNPSRSEASGHRLSNSSSEPRRLGIHDNISFSITTQNDIHPANDQSEHAEAHSYPPSLSSSMASSAPASQAPRIAKNLMKKPKRREYPRSSQPETSHLSGPSSISQLPRQHHPVAPENADWTDSWDDADEWGHRKSSSIGDEQWKITAQSIRVDS